MRAQPLAAVLAVVCLSAVAPARAQAPVRVGLLPVQVHSTDPESSYLSQGLVDMLASRLEQSEAIGVVRVEAEPTSDASAAQTAGRAAEVDYVVFGSFTQFGEGASLDLQCAPVGAEGADTDEKADSGRRIFVASTTLGEIIPKLDELSEKVLRYVSAPPAAPRATVAAGPEPAASELDDLRGRVEALERAVFYGEGTPEAGTSGPGESEDRGERSAPADPGSAP